MLDSRLRGNDSFHNLRLEDFKLPVLDDEDNRFMHRIAVGVEREGAQRAFEAFDLSQRIPNSGMINTACVLDRGSNDPGRRVSLRRKLIGIAAIFSIENFNELLAGRDTAGETPGRA